MTEEDTFNKLRQISFDRMVFLIKETNVRNEYTYNDKHIAELDSVFKNNGWTIEEYRNRIAYTPYYDTTSFENLA